MTRLQSDPEFIRKNEVHEAKKRAIESQLGVEEKTLVADLAKSGFQVTSVWDLVNTNSSYTAAIPVLMRHLGLSYHPKIHEGIARALTVREARGVAGRTILDELKRANDKSHEVRWALANALTEAADSEIKDEIKTLVTDVCYGDVREILKQALNGLAVR